MTGDKDEISTIMQEKLDKLKEEIIEELSEKIESILASQDEPDPYKKLEAYSREAMIYVEDELARALKSGNKKEIAKIKKKADKIDKMVDEMVKVIEKIKKDDHSNIEFENPLYPAKWPGRSTPAIFRWKNYNRGARNWLGFLVTGVGLIILGRGIWDASAELFTIQGSIVIGAIMMGLMAWLERRKLFDVFAGD